MRALGRWRAASPLRASTIATVNWLVGLVALLYWAAALVVAVGATILALIACAGRRAELAASNA